MAFDFSEMKEGDIIEPEEYRGDEPNKFNHQVLVMEGLRKCMNAGSTDLKEGYWDEKFDKFGGVHKTYHEDTRKVFVESVKSLLMIMTCDFDEEANKIIPNILKEIDDRKAFWQNEEWKWWCSLSAMEQQNLNKQGKHVMKGFFNAKLSFDNYFYEEETKLYRKICTELSNLTKRLDFYGEIGYMA